MRLLLVLLRVWSRQPQSWTAPVPAAPKQDQWPYTEKANVPLITNFDWKTIKKLQLYGNRQPYEYDFLTQYALTKFSQKFDKKPILTDAAPSKGEEKKKEHDNHKQSRICILDKLKSLTSIFDSVSHDQSFFYHSS